MSDQARQTGSTAGAGHRRSARAAIVERLVDDCVAAQLDRTGRDHLEVLDAGGGTGTIAVPLAEAGHQVTVVDPSPDSLAALERRAADAGVRHRIRAVQGDASGLHEIVATESADLVLCHNVLEFVDDPAAALAAMAQVTARGGALSVLVANRTAMVLARALAGQLREARALLIGDATRNGRDESGRFTIDELHGLLRGAGYAVAATHGVPVFADLVPAGSVDRGHPHQGFDALLALDFAASEDPTFRGLGSQLHVLARVEPA